MMPQIVLAAVVSLLAAAPASDSRNVRSGLVIPDEGYCDQPYVVIRKDGAWLCTLTTGKGIEGQLGQHVASTISRDKGRTWSPLVDIEPANGPEASWVMPLITPSGRVYVFYDFNGDRVSTLGEKKNIRADMLGWYAYKYSDDGGETWSKDRYRLPVRVTACDRGNDWAGQVQILWGIGKPIVNGQSVLFGFTKLGKYMLDQGEGWFFRSDNILTESDVSRIDWQMVPDGEHGMRAPEFGSVQEEHNLVPLSDGGLYCIYRTTTGHPCHAYSRDGGRTWTKPEHATYAPGGPKIKHPRACPKIWRAKNGKYLLWYHNHGGKSFEDRNPAWLAGGVEREGRIHWSQPEILLYDPEVKTRMSYPDLIEQDGRYWVTETQKEVARVHEIDASLLEGLWSRGQDRGVTTKGLVLSWKAGEAKKVAMPDLPALANGGGFSIDMGVRFDSLSADQILLDSRDDKGVGIVLTTTQAGTVRITMSDGKTSGTWDSDPGAIKAGKPHRLAVVVDGGPKIITFVVDGVLCDGGDARQYGWGRFSDKLGNIGGADQLQVAPKLNGELRFLQIYDRYLRTSEAVANHSVRPS